MRDRGKLTRALVVAAALGVAAFVVSRRLVRGSAAPEIPADVRAAVEEGIAAGSNGRAAAAEPEWIPVAAPAEPSEETLPDAGLAAPA
jgi:hypothetical protein